jgi:hypothetical protein
MKAPFIWIQRLASTSAIAVAALSFPVTTQAQFSDFTGNTDAGWTRYDPLGTLGAGAKASFSVTSGVYVIQALASPNPSAAGPGRAASLRNDANYTDFYLSVDLVSWNNSLNQVIGILARLRETGLGTTDGYLFSYQTTAHDIQINRVSNEAGTAISTTVPITLDPAVGYRLVFTGTGLEMMGRVYARTNLNTPLATVAAIEDSTYPSGVAGLLVYDNTSAGTGTASAAFDNYFGAAAEPQLLVEYADGITRVSWPANALILQRTTSLTPPVTWENITNGITTLNGRNRFDHTPMGTAFFRLAR